MEKGRENKTIFIGCDDSGYEAKLILFPLLDRMGLRFVDCGSGPEPSRYPYYAAKVAAAVSDSRADFGILVCGTGIGMSIVANKFPGVRAAVVTDPYSAKLTRRHNDSNVLCLGGQMLGSWQLTQITYAWLTTDYDGGHHEPSLALIRELEQDTMTGTLWTPDVLPYSPFSWNPEQGL